ncbi:hypothetical protein N0V90_010576 [Kalmusia sp. IMI 367209]|nr:hypothetical protein N0V90_010576 [Kalmusia sp. IMI 367209]
MPLLSNLRTVVSLESTSIIFLLPIAIFVSFWLLPALHGFIVSPTRRVPGPLLTRFTKWWEYRAVLKGDSNLEYIRLHEKYGSVVRMGPNRYSFTRPQDIKVIYELGGSFAKSAYYSPLGDPPNLFAMRDRNEHKDRRRKISSLFTMSTIISYEDAVDRMTRVCIRKLRQFADENRLFSLPQFAQYYAFDVIGEITFGQSFDMMENEGDVHDMIKGIHWVNDYISTNGIVPELHPWLRWLSELLGKESPAAIVRRYTATQIEKHREKNAFASENSKYDTFLKKLMDLETAHRIAADNMFDAAGANIAAGSDTTAISLSATFFYLYKNPEKLASLRHEIDTMAGEGRISDPVTFQEAQNMPYLQAVIKETLRIHPAVGTMLARVVPEGGANLAGVNFPEGSEVGANAWALHYSKDIYGPDAHEFKPERWLKLNDGKSDPREAVWIPVRMSPKHVDKKLIITLTSLELAREPALGKISASSS